ncbi:hypothetical protein [Acinetobacter qingfengensis]|uniref:hypothetical protein n=1 Tax=Acinetobacter qingfengensis TaxID=1262585 RepID=UPI001487F6E1|nr:hypothetical protein [Acinetobacter qingfengensis]
MSKHDIEITGYERCFASILYAVLGIALGYAISMLWAIGVSSHTSPLIIILITSLLCAVIAFFRPYLLPRLIYKLWHFLF